MNITAHMTFPLSGSVSATAAVNGVPFECRLRGYLGTRSNSAWHNTTTGARASAAEEAALRAASAAAYAAACV